MKDSSATIGELKTRLDAGLPLNAQLLELALGVIADGIKRNPVNERFLGSIGSKLKGGTALSNYERRFVTDVLLHLEMRLR